MIRYYLLYQSLTKHRRNSTAHDPDPIISGGRLSEAARLLKP